VVEANEGQGFSRKGMYSGPGPRWNRPYVVSGPPCRHKGRPAAKRTGTPPGSMGATAHIEACQIDVTHVSCFPKRTSLTSCGRRTYSLYTRTAYVPT
jgi:hypothetical protein